MWMRCSTSWAMSWSPSVGDGDDAAERAVASWMVERVFSCLRTELGPAGS
jgi:hypothetical protein